jgi:hypothetical protein
MKQRRERSYSSHLPVLIRAVLATDGPVLEMGTGMFSTPVLHWLCAEHRELVSYETDEKYAALAEQYREPWHAIRLVPDWDAALIERQWDVALVDHRPGERRKEDIRRLAPWARLIVVHDTCARDDKWYRYSDVFPLFRYSWSTRYRPRTTVLSNAVDVGTMAWG